MSSPRTLTELQPGKTPRERPGQVGGKRDENRQKRTRVLCESALRLFLEHGIEGATIDDIVRDANVAKGSFYRYFADKPDLVDALLAPLTGHMRDAFTRCERALQNADAIASLSQPYLDLASELLALIVHDADVVRLYLQESRAPAAGARAPIGMLANEIVERATALSVTARDHGLTRHTDPRVTAIAVVGAVEHLIFRFLAGDVLGAPDEIPSTLIALILDGVRAAP